MEYEPGTCNIGPGERQKRSYIGIIGFLLAAGVLTGILYLDFPSLTLAPLFLCFLVGFEGYFQTRYSFCAGFAMQGVYDMSEDGDDRNEVADETAHSKDVRRAVTIHLYAIGSALLTTAVAYSMLFSG